MLKIKLIFFVIITTLVACAPIFESSEKVVEPSCSAEITGQFMSAKMYPKYILLEKENSDYAVYDLTQQATNCDTDLSDNLLFLFGRDDTKKIAKGLRLSAASEPEMTIKSFAKNRLNFQKTVELKCEQMKLNFLFGLDSEEGPVIGCQTTPNAKSAIMFRQSEKNNNEIIIAALSFYEPLLNKFID
jgi:hypothetical protein